MSCPFNAKERDTLYWKTVIQQALTGSDIARALRLTPTQITMLSIQAGARVGAEVRMIDGGGLREPEPIRASSPPSPREREGEAA